MPPIAVRMIVLISMSLGMLLAGCKPEPSAHSDPTPKPRNDRRELIERLDQAGFYRHCENAAKAEEARQAAIHGGPLFSEAVRRSCPMDTEKLTNGGVREFMETCKERFTERGVNLESIEQVFVVGLGYFAVINKEEFEIYDEGDTQQRVLWDKTVVSTFVMGNDLLGRAGSNDRMFQIRSEHEAIAVFLDEELFNLLQGASIPDEDKPRVTVVRTQP